MSLLGTIAKYTTPKLPPRDLTNHDAVYTWMVNVTVAQLIVFGVIMTHLALVWGLIPVFFPGFSSKADVESAVQRSTQQIERTIRQTSKTNTDSVKAEIWAGRLFTYRASQCAAIRAGNMDLARTIGAQIAEARANYLALTHEVFEIRPCDEF